MAGRGTVAWVWSGVPTIGPYVVILVLTVTAGVVKLARDNEFAIMRASYTGERAWP